MSAINIYFYLLMISECEGDVVTFCKVPNVNVGYKYLLLFTYDFRLFMNFWNPLFQVFHKANKFIELSHSNKVHASCNQTHKNFRFTHSKQIHWTMVQIRCMFFTIKLITRLLTRLQFVPATCSYCNTKTTIR